MDQYTYIVPTCSAEDERRGGVSDNGTPDSSRNVLDCPTTVLYRETAVVNKLQSRSTSVLAASQSNADLVFQAWDIVPLYSPHAGLTVRVWFKQVESTYHRLKLTDIAYGVFTSQS
ncbi:hypothetical protein BaRGS_00032248 [Batillaria attramentaria]|uniref:Uncharacterized protein n=1 Tax=Batillaria attramentaria TaxID=370345 RepID=A0ABD0JP78_9CAEN